ncbi:hypothetical protein SAMN04488008_1031 [Maribacter orientalis]|uniref:Uncharacterized protein n=1 Tax=Maribacter orientalis TaxID=228957 RepID=A0A1H7MUN4_9FLAO|nr:hypothetical protein [Maribacter orientalis]SEL14498.1 hypothetical protein SAMN04488008_1031 [Maribacter orientalis]
MKKIPFILFFLCAFAKGQNIKELYAERFEDDWKVYKDENYVKKYIDTTIVYKLESGRSPEEELLFQAKENHNKRAERLSQIFSSLKINLKELDSLVFIEQRSTNSNFENDFVKKGAIITNDSIYGFSYDLDDENQGIKRSNYFQNSKNETLNQAKVIIGNLVLSSKTNYLDSLAKVESEMLAGPLKDLIPETEFEILIFNKKKGNELRRIYLHETFVRIINQK